MKTEIVGHRYIGDAILIKVRKTPSQFWSVWFGLEIIEKEYIDSGDYDYNMYDKRMIKWLIYPEFKMYGTCKTLDNYCILLKRMKTEFKDNTL